MQEIKKQLANSLEKVGYSLFDLEDALSKINTAEGQTKFASITKSALIGEISGAAKAGGDLLSTLLQGGLLSSAVVGGGLGGAGLLVDRHLRNQDDKFTQKQHEIDKLRSTMERIKQEHGAQM